MLEELVEARNIAQGLAEAKGFGAFDSAQQLQNGFAVKGAGTPSSALERIQQFTEALTSLRDAFASGGEAFLDAESDWARRLTHAGQEF
ncbi:hypothetical protein [Rhodococcus chondri]|nr:hypothetical protein [Rhodococcus sp. CC-R104]